MTNALFPLDRAWWFVRNIVDDSIDSPFDRVGNSRTDLLQDVMRYLGISCDIPSMLRTARTTIAFTIGTYITMDTH